MIVTGTRSAARIGNVGNAIAISPRQPTAAVFIDSRVPDLAQLIDGIKPGQLVVVIDAAADGVRQIADALAANKLRDLSAIHIVSHGRPGEIELGATRLDARALASHAALLAEIGASLAPGGDILLYGCDVARGAAGRDFVAELSVYTGADVAAATHKVGAAEQGASWELDVATGPIAAGLAFSAQTIAAYRGVLVAPTTDLNGAGAGTNETASFTEQTPVVIAPAATIADTDSTNLTKLTATLTARPDGNGVESLSLNAAAQTAATGAGLAVLYTPGTGVLLITGPALPTVSLATYQTILQGIVYNNTSDTPTTTARNVDVVVTDDTVSSSAANSVTISVTAVNDQPTLTATPVSPTYVEGAAAADLFSGVTVSTVEAGQSITSLTLTVSNVTNGANEILFFDGSDVALTNGNAVTTATNGLSVTVTVAANTATVTFSGATLSEVQTQTLVDGLTYRNTSQDPTDANRVVTITQIVDSGPNGGVNNDDNVSSPGIASTVNVDPVNDQPTLTATPANPTYVEGAAAADLFSAVTVSTIEAGQTITSLTLTVSNVTDGANEILFFDGSDVALTDGNLVATTLTNGLSVSVSVLANTATVTFSGATLTEAQAQALVDGLTYRNTSQDPTDGNRVVTITQLVDSGANGGANNDDNVSSPGIASTVNVDPVNDEPTLTATPANPTFVEGAAAVDLFSGVTASTVEAGQSITSLTLTVSNVTDGASEILFFDGSDVALTNGNAVTTTTNGLSVTVTVAANTATVTFSGATLSTTELQTLVDGLTYRNTSQDPTDANRVVTITQLVDSGANGGVNNDDNVSNPGLASTVNVDPVNDEPTLTATPTSPTFAENGAAVDLFNTVSISTIEAAQNLDQLVLTVSNVAGTGATENLTIDGTIVVLTNGNSQTTATNGMTAAVALSGGTATVTISKVGGISSTLMQTLVDNLAYDNTSEDPGTASRAVTLTSLRDTGPNGGVNNDDNITTLTTVSTVSVTVTNDEPTLTATPVNPTYVEGAAAADLFSTVTASTVEAGQSITSLTLTVSNVTDGASEILFFDGSDVALTNGNSVTTTTNGLTVNVTVAANTATVTFSGATLSEAQAQTLVDGLTYRNTSQDPTNANRAVTITQLVDSGANGSGNDNTSNPGLISTVNVDPVNDEPTLTATGATVTFTEGAAAVDLFSGVTASTVEAGQSIASLTLTVSNVTNGANEILFFDGSDVALINGNSVLTTGNGLTVNVTVAVNTATVTFSGASLTTTDLQTLVDGLTYRNTSEDPTDANRVVTITQLVDSGPNGGANNDDNTATLAIAATVNVDPVNDKPTLTANAANTTFTEGGAAGASVQGAAVAVFTGTNTSTIEAGQGIISLTFTVNGLQDGANERLVIDGTAITLGGNSSGTTGGGINVGYNVTVAGPFATITLTKASPGVTPANINALINGITYQDTNVNNPAQGDRTFTLTQVRDNGGGTDTTTLSIPSVVHVVGVNDGPTNTAPAGPLAASEDTNLSVTGISVADPDAAPQHVSVTLSVLHGTLDVLNGVPGGVDNAHISGDTTGSVTLTGTPAEINTTLGAVNGLIYRGNLNYTGPDTITVNTSDLGHTGTPGTPLTDSDPIAITVAAVVANTLSATQTTTLATDNDGDGVIDPGDHVTVTVKIANNSTTTTATGVSFNETLNGLTQNGAVHVTPIAFDDSFTGVVGNSPIHLNVLANDIDPNSSTPLSNVGLTITSVDTTGTNGTVTIDPGSTTVTFTPTTGFQGTTTFKYFTTDAEGLPSNEPATVTVTVNGGMVWYVDANASSVGQDGSFAHAFTSLTQLNGVTGDGSINDDVDVAGDTIFVYSDTATPITYTGGIVLEGTQKLLGDGVAFSVNGIAIGHATDDAAHGPTITSTAAAANDITLGSGNTLRGFTLGNTNGGVALSGTNFGTLTVDNVAINTNNTAISLNTGAFAAGASFSSVSVSTAGITDVSLTGVTGTVDLGNGTMNGQFAVSGGTVNTTYSGNITQSGNAALVNVSGGHTGTLLFQTGTLTATNGTGLQFDNADGTYNFTGTVALNNSVGGANANAGINIVNGSGGAFSFSSTSSSIINQNTGTAFNVNGGGGNVTYAGTIGTTNATTDNHGNTSVNITNKTAGTVNFSGNILDSNDANGGIGISGNASTTINFSGTSKALNTGIGDAVSMTTNAGSTINFTNGGLVIQTTNGTGFSDFVSGTVSVQGSGNTITATGSGAAVNLGNVAIGASGFTFDTTSAAGGAFGVKLASITGGAIALGNGTLSGATGSEFLVGDGAGTANTGGTAAITYAGTISTTGTARTVDIQDRAAGAANITLSGTVSHASGNGSTVWLDQNAAGTIAFTAANMVANSGTQDAIHLTGNTGAIINFSGGGLNIDTTTGAGFLATGGGTVSVTGTANSIASVGGTALNVANTTIGGSGLTFHDISANGGANGIVLNTTGASGGLTVTGNLPGTAGDLAGTNNNGSGGLIQNTTGAGILLNSTQNVSFDQLNISGTSGSGVNGTGVTNFSHTNSTFTNTGDASVGPGQSAHDSAISFNGTNTGVGNNIAGTLTVTGNTITNAFYAGVNVESDAGTVTFANISNNVITNPGFSGVNFNTTGTATTAFSLNDADINNNNITSSGGNGIQISMGNGNAGASGAAATTHAGFVTLDGTGRPISDPSHIISITNNLITIDSGGTQVITVASTSASNSARTQINFEILNNGTVANPLTGSLIGTDILIGNNGFSDMAGVIDGNRIDANHTANGGGGNGIGGGNGVGGAGTAWTPQLSLSVSNNVITDTDGNGILLVNRATNGEADFKIFNNNVAAPINVGGSTRQGIRVDAGNNTAGEDASVFLNIFGNTSAGSNGGSGIGIRKNGTVGTVNDFGIFDAAGGPSLAATPTNTDITNFINALNPGSATGGAFGTGGTDIISGSNFLRDTTQAPPLLAAPGGVEAVPAGSTWSLAGTANFSGVAGSNDLLWVNQNGLLRADTMNGDQVANWHILGQLGEGWNLVGTANFNGDAISDLLLQHTSGAFQAALIQNYTIAATADVAMVDGTLQVVTPPAPPADPAPADPAPAATGNPPAVTPPASTASGTVETHLTQAELNSIVSEAIARWEATGLTAEQSAYLHNLTFSIDDMANLNLGSAVPGHITIDSDAAGYGWYIDAAPADDAEFGNALSATRLQTDGFGVPAGHIDLLSTLMHEMGHQLGLEDTYLLADQDSLMYGYLVTGERRLAAAHQADGATPGSIAHEEFAVGPISLGSLPAGRTVTITLDATVDSQTNQQIVNPSNQGAVSATNPPADFPDVNTNTNVTTLDTLTLSGLVFNNLNFDSDYDAGIDAGVNGVTLRLYADTNGNGGLDAGDTLIASTTTAGGGLYSFTGLAPGDYIVAVQTANFNAGGALFDGPNNTALTSIPGNPDPDNNVANDDNGGSTGVAGVSIASLPITLAYNTEPTAGTGNDTNNTLDLGFQGVPPNNPPVVTAGNTVTFTEVGAGGPAIFVDNAITVTDDGTTIDSATVTISSGLFTGDVLTFDTALASSHGITGGFAAGVLSLSGTATPGDYEAVLQTVKYQSTSDNPSNFGAVANTTRTITWTVNDGTQNNVVAATTTINIAAENDSPHIATSGGFAGNPSTPIPITGITFSDLDGTVELVTFTVGTGALAATTGGGVTVGGSPTALTLTGTLANLNSFIAGGNLTFTGTQNATLGIDINDQGHTGTPAALNESTALSITIDAVPVIANLDGDTRTFTEGGSPLLLDLGGDAVVTDTDSPDFNVGNVTVSISAGGVNAEDVLSIVDGGNITVSSGTVLHSGNAIGTVTGGTGGAALVVIFNSSGLATPAVVSDLVRQIAYQNTNTADPSTAARTVSFTVNDGDGATSVASDVTVNITALNDPPQNTVPAGPLSVNEDTNLAITGLSVSDVDIAAGNITVTLTVLHGTIHVLDTVGGGLAAADITNNDSASVTLSSDPASINATLAALNGVVYHGAADYHGPDQFAMHTDDNGNTPPPAETADSTVNITVNSVNDAPSGADITKTIDEDQTYTITAADFGFSDTHDGPPNGTANALLNVKITSLASAGTLTNNGVAIVLGVNDVISKADVDAGLLKYIPVADANGAPNPQFTFQLQDDGGGTDLSTGNTFAFDITSVNDEPSGTNVTKTILEDGVYNTFTAADFGFTDVHDSPANGLSGVIITTLPTAGLLELNGNPVSENDFVGVLDIPNLVFTPDPNANGTGYSSFTFQVVDDGGTPGVDTDQTPNTFTFDVTSVNDAPEGTDNTVTTNEDVPYEFQSVDFGFSDFNDDPSNAFIAVKITSLPLLGTLKVGGVPVAVNDIVSVTIANHLTYEPPLNASGDNYTSFTFEVVDSGPGTAPDENTDPTPRTMTINLAPVNDAPAFGNLGPNPGFTENGSSVTLDSDATISDVELDLLNAGSGDYGGTTLTLARHGGANPDDVFGSTNPLDLSNGNLVSLDGGTTFIGTYTNNGDGTFSVTFDPGVTRADVQEVMRHITYFNASDNPPLTVQIDYSLNDGNTGAQGSGGEGVSNGVNDHVTVNITQVDDAPSVSNVAVAASYALGSSGVAVSPGIAVFDVDATPPSLLTGLASATVKIDAGFFAGDQLFVNLPTSGGFFIVDDGGPVVTNISVQSNVLGQMVLSGNDTVAHYQAVLNAVSYRSTAVDPSNGGANPTRSITWQVNDGALNSQTPDPNPLTLLNTTILHFNAPPTLDLDASGAGTGFTTTFTERDAPLRIVDTDLLITDPDNTTMSQATIVLTNAKASDVLSIAGALPGGIDSSIDTSVAGQITVHLFNAASIAEYQTAIGQIRFSNTSAVPNETDRDITITVSDGDANSNVTHATVHVVDLLTIHDDFNADGTSDILWRHNNGFVSEWQMGGGQLINNLGIGMPTPAGAYRFQDTGDFNADGHTDILWRHDVGQVELWTMNGNQIVGNQAVASLGIEWHGQGVADFGGDGKSDVLWRHDSGQFALWTMDGGQITNNQSVATVSNAYHTQGLLDANGDGKSDVLLRHDSGQVVLWTMNGAQITNNQAIANVGLDWNIVGTGDFDGDGKDDILWRHDSGQVVIWKMNGAQIVSNTSVATPGNEWKVQDVGDYNGDTKSDILWRNDNSGQVVVWEMNGSQITSNHEVSSNGQPVKIGAEWTVQNHHYDLF